MTIMAAVMSTVRAKNSPLFSRVRPMISSLVQAKSTVARPAKMNSRRKNCAMPSTMIMSPMTVQPPAGMVWPRAATA